jgi:two-component system, response regulator
MTALDSNIVIVLVDDNEDDRMLAARALQRAGVVNDVIMLADGVEALEFFAQATKSDATAPRTYLVLLDLNMPRLGGLEVLRRLRADGATRRLQIVMLTSSDEDRDRVDSYELGANSYIRKPVDFAQFSEVMRQLGHYWLALNRPAPGGLTSNGAERSAAGAKGPPPAVVGKGDQPTR